MGILTENYSLDFLLVLTLLLVVIVFAYFKRSFLYWKKMGVYSLTPTFPFGNIKQLVMQKRGFEAELKHVYDVLKNMNKRYGGYYFFIRPIFIPVDLDLIKSIMTVDFEHFTDRVLLVNEEYDPLSAHLFALKGQRWRNMRVKLTPIFTSGKIKMMFQTLMECTNDLVESMEKKVNSKEAINIKEFVGKFTLDVIGSCAFGIECNSFKNPDSLFVSFLGKFFNTSLEDSIIRFLGFTLPELLAYFKIKFIKKDLTNFFLNLVEENIKYREANNVVRNDFMHLLLQIKNNVNGDEDATNVTKRVDQNKPESLTLAEIAAQCFVFFAAGYETSSSTTSFCLYELSVNPDLQRRVRKEIKTVLERHNGQITYDALMEMNYLNKCIFETLRKYPPIPAHFRECTKDYKIFNSDVTLKKGTFVFVPIFAIQRDAEYYPNPDVFDPERFSEEAKGTRHNSLWTPFGDGPRFCIGFRFGLFQIKATLVTLLRNYSFSLNLKTEIPLQFNPKSFTLNTTSGIWLDAKYVS